METDKEGLLVSGVLDRSDHRAADWVTVWTFDNLFDLTKHACTSANWTTRCGSKMTTPCSPTP